MARHRRTPKLEPFNAFDALPPELQAALAPVNKAVARAQAQHAREPVPKDSSDRAKPKPVHGVPRPGGSIPNAAGKLIAGPPAPITAPGTRAEEIRPAQVMHAAAATAAANRRAQASRKRAERSAAVFDAFLKRHPETTLQPSAYKRWQTLQTAARADYNRYRTHSENVGVAIDAYDDLVTRAGEYRGAQRTGGIYGAPPKPTKDEIHEYVNSVGKAGHLTEEQIAYYHLPTFESMLDKLGGFEHVAGNVFGGARKVVATVADLMPAAQAPVAPGDEPKQPLGVKPIDLGGRTLGAGVGTAALGAAGVSAAAHGIAAYGRGWSGREATPKHEEASPINSELAIGGAKILVGGAGTLKALHDDPKEASKAIYRDARDMLVGTTQIPGLLAAMTAPTTSWSDVVERYDLARDQVIEPFIADLVTKYGGDVGFEQVMEDAKKHPLIYGLNAAAILSVGARILTLGIGRISGLTMGEALRQMRVPVKQRILTAQVQPTTVRRNIPRTMTLPGGKVVKGVGRKPLIRDGNGDPVMTEAGQAMQVLVPQARNPLYRATVSAPYDAVSKILGKIPYARRTPWAENPRALRQLERNNSRMRRRLPAEARSIFAEIDALVRNDPHAGVALSTLLQKPDGFSDEEWVEAAIENMKRMITTGEFIGPEGQMTPAVQRLVGRIRSYESKHEAARTRRQSRASARISEDQLRLSTTLDGLAAYRQLLLEERKHIKDDPEMTDEQKAYWQSENDLQLRANTAQRNVARQHLEDMSIHQEPVDSPARDAYKAKLGSLPKFGGDMPEVSPEDAGHRRLQQELFPGVEPLPGMYTKPVGGPLDDLPDPKVQPKTTRVVEPDPNAEPPPMMGHRRVYRVEVEDPNGGPSTVRWTADRDEAAAHLPPEELDDNGEPIPGEQLQFVDLNRQEWRGLVSDKDGYILPSDLAARAESGNTYLRGLWDEYQGLRDKPTALTHAERTRLRELDRYFREPRTKAAIEASRPGLIGRATARRDEKLADNQSQLLEDAMLISDTAARRWGDFYNRDPGEYYEHALQLELVDDAGQIPEGAMYQNRPSRLQEERDRREAEGTGLNEADLPDEDALRALAFDGVDESVFRDHDIDNFLKKIPEYLRRGAKYRFWYEDSAKQILDFTNGDKDLANRIAQLAAIYSASRKPTENINLAIQAYRQWERGEPINVSSKVQSEKAEKAMRDEDWGSRKTNRFWANMLEDIDAEKFLEEFEGGEVTNDIWMARLFGLKTDIPTPREYDAMTTITQNIADALGWKPKQVQAALWVPAKADAGRTVTGEGGVKKVVPMDDHEAGIDFARALEQESARVEVGVVPTRPGFLRAYTELDPDSRDAYMREKADAVTEYLRDSGLLGRVEAEGVEVFGDTTSPTFTIVIPQPVGRLPTGRTSPKTGEEIKTPISYSLPEGRRRLDAAISTIGEALDRDSMMWARPIYRRGEAKDQNGVDIRPDRPFTDDEIVKIRTTLKDRLGRDVAVVTGPDDGLLVLHYGAGKGKGQLRHTEFHDEVERVVQEVGEAGDDLHTEQVIFRFDGNRKTRSEYGQGHYVKKAGRAGRPDVQSADRRLRERSADIDRHYLGDPDAPDAGSAGAVARGFREPLAQTRKGDILGASRWLETAPGRRILYLTPQADVSTLLHELIGHGAYEMKAFHPEEFVRVEEHIGKRLEDWGVDEHEQFAKWAERYFADGYAPTPELVDAMGRLKTWMRSIYGGMIRLLGGRLPVATRVLFDTYFGAYDDQNVARIAMNMGLEGYGREDFDIARWGSAMAVSKDELRALKSRQQSRRARQTAAGQKVRLADLEKRLQELNEQPGPWTEKDHNEYIALATEIPRRQAEEVIRVDKREQNLRKKIDSLEKALSRGFDNRRFQGALTAMQTLSKMREDTLRAAFGDDFDAVFGENFEARTDLLADFFVSRGLLHADFTRGSAHYFPHMAIDPRGLPPQTPAVSLTSRVVGPTKANLLNLYKRNQMILWQQGAWNADPAVLMESVLRAMSYSWMNEMKKQLWSLGRAITEDELSALPDDVYVINLKGTPISLGMRRQLNGGMETFDAQGVHDAIDHTDNDKLENSLKSYWNNAVIDGKTKPESVNLVAMARQRTAEQELRIVPKEVVHALLRPLRGGRNPFGKGWDIATSMARFSLIYANAPAYMLSNAGGNLGLLLLQQGPFQLAKTMALSSKLLGDHRLMIRIMGETGDLPAFAAISRGRAFDQGSVDASRLAARGEQWWLDKLSVVDRYPRALAWLYEANKLGYRSSDDLMRLLDAKDKTTFRHREIVSDSATNHMIDFNRLRPWEQQTLTRALFIWPFVRGSTAWPFWYAKNYPERTAVVANLAMTLEERRKRMLTSPGIHLAPGQSPTPRQYDTLFPVSRTSATRAEVINAGSLSPTSVLANELAGAGDGIKYLLAAFHGEDSGESVNALIDMLSPVVTTLGEIITQRDDFGRQLGGADIGMDLMDTFIPGERLLMSALGDKALGGNRTPRAFLDDSGPGDRARRTHLRIPPQTVSLPWLNAMAMSHAKKTTEQRINEQVALNMADYDTLFPGKPYPAGYRRAVVMKTVFEDRVNMLATERSGRGTSFEPKRTRVSEVTHSNEWDTRYRPTPYDRAVVAWAVLQKYMPKSGITSPNSMLLELGAKPESVTGKKFMDIWLKMFEAELKPANVTEAKAAITEFGDDYAKEIEQMQKAGYLTKEYQEVTPKARAAARKAFDPAGG